LNFSTAFNPKRLPTCELETIIFDFPARYWQIKGVRRAPFGFTIATVAVIGRQFESRGALERVITQQLLDHNSELRLMVRCQK
jgi:hypothetical protein